MTENTTVSQASFLDELAIDARGKPLTDKERIALLAHYQASFNRNLGDLRAAGDLPPLVVPPRTRSLYQSQRDFFIGAIALGNLTVKRIDWGGNGAVHNYHTVVVTESKRPSRRKMLKETIGLWAQGSGLLSESPIRETPKSLRIYLPHDRFRFLLRGEANLTDEVMNNIEEFAPSAFGFTTNGLIGEENRIPYPDFSLLEKIYEGFKGHFGFKIGKLQHRNYRDIEGDVQTNAGVIIIPQNKWEEVTGALLGVKSVRRLGFLKALEAGYIPGG